MRQRVRGGSGKGLKKNPKPVREARVAFCHALLLAGHTYTAIKRAADVAQLKEVDQRNAALLMGLQGDDLAKAVPMVWGDKPCPPRTVQNYIAIAKTQIVREGRRTAKNRGFILGQQMSRIHTLYASAFVAKQYGTCVRLIEIVNDMFGIREATRIVIEETRSSLGIDLSKLTVTELDQLKALVQKAMVRARDPGAASDLAQPSFALPPTTAPQKLLPAPSPVGGVIVVDRNAIRTL